MTAIPSDLALTTIADGSQRVAAPVRNNFAAIQSAVNDLIGYLSNVYTVYSPVWTCASGTAPDKGNGTLTGRWTQVGKLVQGSLVLTAGSSTTFGNGGAFLFTLPAAANALLDTNFPVGQAAIHDASAGADYIYSVGINTSTTVALFSPAQPAGTANQTVPVTFATTDVIRVSFAYEAA